MAYSKMIFYNFPALAEENHESGYPVCGPKFEAGAYKV
jgi:hypothetical protein